MRSAPAPTRLELQPLGSDPRALGLEDGARIWGAYTSDPKFVATPGAPIAPGWYLATARIDGRSGDIDEPRLYVPDSAGHYHEARSVAMTRRGPAFEARIHIAHAARALRFDPSQAPCEFACGGLELTRLGWVERLRDRLAPAHSGPEPGPAQARSPTSHAPMPTEARKRLVLQQIDKEGHGIEIGAGIDPIAPKRDGYKVHVIDHASREELLGKYREHGIGLERLEEVDFVWRGQGYLELTGRPKFYDWIIASNVVEHTTDLIGFLADCDAILKDGGVLCLVVPDKRYCFDRFRPVTGLARIIDAHDARPRVHTPGVAAEYFLNVVTREGEHSWSAGSVGDYTFLHSAQQAREMMQEVREKGSYLDVHNWCFVPSSFRLLANDLYTLGYTKLREVSFHPTAGWEFHVTLGRHGAGPDKSRLELLRAIDAELAAVDRP